MARLNAVIQTAEVALSAATAKTVIQLTSPSNHRVAVLGWGVFFDGTSVTAEPVQVRLLRQTSAGTMSALTPVAMDGSVGETIQSTAQHTASAEPSSGNVVDVIECHPQQGYEKIFPMGQEIILAGAGRVGIECTAPATVNVRAKIFFEE
jgi:hypothetical protein